MPVTQKEEELYLIEAALLDISVLSAQSLLFGSVDDERYSLLLYDKPCFFDDLPTFEKNGPKSPWRFIYILFSPEKVLGYFLQKWAKRPFLGVFSPPNRAD